MASESRQQEVLCEVPQLAWVTGGKVGPIRNAVQHSASTDIEQREQNRNAMAELESLCFGKLRARDVICGRQLVLTKRSACAQPEAG